MNVGDSYNRTPLLHAVLNYDEKGLRTLIEAGADVNVRTLKGNTALNVALRHGYVGVVRKLLRAGVDVNIEDGSGNTALLYAIKNRQIRYISVETVASIVDAGANVNTKDRLGQWRIQDFPRGGRQLQNCYYFSHFCRKLHENERIWTPRGARVPGAPLGSANAGETPLMVSVWYGDKPCTELLIESGSRRE